MADLFTPDVLDLISAAVGLGGPAVVICCLIYAYFSKPQS